MESDCIACYNNAKIRKRRRDCMSEEIISKSVVEGNYVDLCAKVDVFIIWNSYIATKYLVVYGSKKKHMLL